MSTKYKMPKEVPDSVIISRTLELADAITKGAKNELTMRIPAECDRDADIVLHEIAKRFEAATAERDALKAQVELLRDFASLIVEWKEYGFEKAQALLDLTPIQCLTEIKVQAGRDGYVEGVFDRSLGAMKPEEVKQGADKYANQLRQQAKAKQ